MTWYDLSPMRPDEFGRQSAYRWTLATDCRAAFEAGMHDAAREGEARAKLSAMEQQA